MTGSELRRWTRENTCSLPVSDNAWSSLSKAAIESLANVGADLSRCSSYAELVSEITWLLGQSTRPH
jgi:hypothetical protein